MELLLRTRVGADLAEAIADVDVDLNIPALCDVEVAAALRRSVLLKTLTEERLGDALEDYLDLPLTRHGHAWLVPRILDLRANFSAYDATYVALAELLGAELITADEALARATRTHTGVAVRSSSP